MNEKGKAIGMTKTDVAKIIRARTKLAKVTQMLDDFRGATGASHPDEDDVSAMATIIDGLFSTYLEADGED